MDNCNVEKFKIEAYTTALERYNTLVKSLKIIEDRLSQIVECGEQADEDEFKQLVTVYKSFNKSLDNVYKDLRTFIPSEVKNVKEVDISKFKKEDGSIDIKAILTNQILDLYQSINYLLQQIKITNPTCVEFYKLNANVNSLLERISPLIRTLKDIYEFEIKQDQADDDEDIPEPFSMKELQDLYLQLQKEKDLVKEKSQNVIEC